MPLIVNSFIVISDKQEQSPQKQYFYFKKNNWLSTNRNNKIDIHRDNEYDK